MVPNRQTRQTKPFFGDTTDTLLADLALTKAEITLESDTGKKPRA